MTKHENKTNRHVHNTRLCAVGGLSAFCGFCARILLVVSRQRIRPQTANAHSLGR